MATLKRRSQRAQKKQNKRSVSPIRDGSDYLESLGKRIRLLRTTRHVTRRELANRSGVSERFLAEVESGSGNASVLILRQLANALDVPLEMLVQDAPEPPAELARAAEILRPLSAGELDEALQWLASRFAQNGGVDRRRRIALLGLRGAGKSTIGAMLAERLDYPFLELDRLIEKATGAQISAILDLYGMSGFRRLERRCLDDVLNENDCFVLATGGGLVSKAATFQRLLDSCFTVWLRADPEDHMKRVIAQGDTRPMAKNPEAMSDLKRILLERESLYRKADLIVDTSGKTVQSVATKIAKQVGAPSTKL